MSSAKFTKKEIVVSKPVISFVVNDIDKKRITTTISCIETLSLIEDLMKALVEAQNQNAQIAMNSDDLEFFKGRVKNLVNKLGIRY